MKFAFISPFPPLRGGISKETETIYNYFNNNGHEVKVINFKRLYPQFLFPGKSQYINNILYNNDKNIITLLDLSKNCKILIISDVSGKSFLILLIA